MVDVLASGPESASSSKPRRWLWLALGGAIAAALTVGILALDRGEPAGKPPTAQGSPADDGFTSVGAVGDVRFWLRALPDGRTAVRSSGGRVGYMCNDAGVLRPGAALCQGSVQGAGSVLVVPVRPGSTAASVPTDSGERQLTVLHLGRPWSTDLAVLVSTDDSLVITGPVTVS